MVGSQSVFARPPLDFVCAQRATIIGCSELSTVCSKALRFLPTPTVLRWTSELRFVVAQLLRCVGLIFRTTRECTQGAAPWAPGTPARAQGCDQHVLVGI